jgi:hypothetical protein
VNNPEVDAPVGERRQARRVPRDASCSVCGETRHLTRPPGINILCYACRAAADGRAAVERDHMAGVANVGGLLIDLRANDHRTVTDIRRLLGIDDWPAAEGDPLLVLAHVIAGFGTVLILLALWLVAFAAHAANGLGPDRWIGAPSIPIA